MRRIAIWTGLCKSRTGRRIIRQNGRYTTGASFARAPPAGRLRHEAGALFIALIAGAANGLGDAYALMRAFRGADIVVNGTNVCKEGSGFSAAAKVVDKIVAAGSVAVPRDNSVATYAAVGHALVDDVRIGHFALRRYSPYAAAKVGLIVLMRTLAVESALRHPD